MKYINSCNLLTVYHLLFFDNLRKIKTKTKKKNALNFHNPNEANDLNLLESLPISLDEIRY